MNHLCHHGISVNLNADCVTVKLCVVCGTVDLQAKAYILNMTMHNGKHGCSICEEEGKVVKKGKGHCRSYPYKKFSDRACMRNATVIEQNVYPIATPTNRIKGICGISGLTGLKFLDIVHGIVPDYMHGVLMGVVKSLLYLWISPTNTKQPRFIGNQIKELSKRLNQIKPPDYIERLPRDLEKHYANFKATELQTWLLFYCIPCTQGILKPQYFSHFCLLSGAIHILLGDSITAEELNSAENMLDKFYKEMANLYGEGSCGLNVHNLGCHLVEFVRKWGPLWAWSCFGFEDANAAILQSVHETGNITKQYIHFKNLQCRLNSTDTSSIEYLQGRHFIEKMKQHRRQWKGTKKMKNCCVAGQPLRLSVKELDDIRELNFAEINNQCRKVLRVDVNGQRFYAEQYRRMIKRVCYIVLTTDSKILKIKYFFTDNVTQNVFALCELLEVKGGILNVEFMLKVVATGENVIVPVEKISEKLFYLNCCSDIFVSRLPNLHGHSVFK